MTKRLDTPRDLAILRMFARDPVHWKGAADIRKALDWLDSPEHGYDGTTWLRIRLMEEAGLLEGRRAATMTAGREWRLAEDANIKRATGGIDVLKMDREEALHAGSDERRQTVEYHPTAYLLAPGNRAKAERAIRQCPSPWDLGQRMQAIKWTNPELT